MTKFKIKHESEKCVGCGLCATLSDNWEMDLEKNIALPKKIDIVESELEKNKEAEENCPVNCIHIEKIE